MDDSEEIDEENLEDFIECGRITAKIREQSKKLIMVEEPIIEIVETIESMIIDAGLKPAFPTNISINQVAAHYTSSSRDTRVIGENDVVKVDLGASLNGAIADTAYTIDLSGKYGKLVEASEKALENAIAHAKPGVEVGKLGQIIEETITSYGFKPISNLTGHKIKRGVLHAGVEIPNIKKTNTYKLKEGDIFAIEPFATTGSGTVTELDEVEIFSLYMPKPLHARKSKEIIKYVLDYSGLLPFAQRWLDKKFRSRLLVSAALKEMIQKQVVITYPVLKDTGNGIVSQAEHTVYIDKDGAKVLTDAGTKNR